MEIEAIRLPLARPGESVRVVVVVRCHDARHIASAQLTLVGEEIERTLFRPLSLERVRHTVAIDVPARLPRGRHELACDVELPSGLPSSYRGRRFAVRYRVEAAIRDRSGRRARADHALQVARDDDDARVLPPRTASSDVYPGGVAVAIALPRGYGVAGGIVEVDVALRGDPSARAQVRHVELTLTGRESARQPVSRFLRRDSRASRWHEVILDRLQWTVNAHGLHGGEPLTVRLRMPPHIAPTVSGECVRCHWTLGARAHGPPAETRCDSWLTILGHAPRRQRPTQLSVVSNIGEPSALEPWRHAAGELALAYHGNRLVGVLGDTHCQVQRELRSGVLFVARIAFAPLGIDLSIRPGDAARGLLGATLGWGPFDRKHAVTARFSTQARAFLSRLPALSSALIDHVEGDDGGLALLVREEASPQALHRLSAIAREVVDGLAGARGAIPPPPMFEAHVSAWRDLAARLEHAELGRGPMAISGKMAGHPCAVTTRWNGRSPVDTRVALLPLRPPGASYHVSLDLAAGHRADMPQLPRAAHELIDELCDGAHALTIDGSGLAVILPAPLPDPLLAYDRLLRLEKLYRALRPGAGPFR